MSAPNNARKVLKCLISDKFLENPGLYGLEGKSEDIIIKRADRLALKIKEVGYTILSERYHTDDVNTCEESFGEYQIIFEHFGLAIIETDILEKIVAGTMSIMDVFGATMDSLKPSANKHIHDDIEIRLQVKSAPKTSKMYVCQKCGFNETIVEQRQIARADEPPTVKATCVRCWAEWKVDK